ncbi:hypothetical protein I7412_35315, partial [Frankia sp. CN6]|nr:hypothetical protein [Frankia nepalensis]
MADDASFDAFYRQSRQRLYDCLYALTGDPAEAPVPQSQPQPAGNAHFRLPDESKEH